MKDTTEKIPPTPVGDGIVTAGSYGDPWPISGAKNMAQILEQVGHRIERLGYDRTAAPVSVFAKKSICRFPRFMRWKRTATARARSSWAVVNIACLLIGGLG